MCTREEVEKIVSESECRQNDKHERAYMSVATTLSNLMADEKEDQRETKDMIAKILAQTTKTNGRVTSLETWKEVHQTENGTLTKKLDDVCTTLQRLNWLLITGVVVALLNLVLQ
jgi:CHASE3 domain sensor protein